jgi:hypothetical protein
MEFGPGTDRTCHGKANMRRELYDKKPDREGS